MENINWTIIISIVTPIALALWTMIKYFSSKKEERRWKEFDVYHELINKLARGGDEIRLAYQSTIVFELRYFKRYWAISLRILEDLHEKWNKDEEKKKKDGTQLLDEMQKTIGFIKNKLAKRKLNSVMKLLSR